jgi:membrane associated rhomboid family serine protease
MARADRNAQALESGVPWLSFGLVCLCLLGFAHAQTRTLEIEALAQSRLVIAADYFRAHPYLLLPQLLEPHIDASTAQRLGQEYETARKRKGTIPRPPRMVASEQVELDEMTRQVASDLESRPEHRFGVIASERNPATFVSHLFFHAGFAHLGICMILLLVLGRRLELAWGSVLTLCAGVAATIGSVGLFLAQQPDQAQPLIGSAGLVSGLAGAFTVRFFGSQSRVAYGPVLILALVGLWLPPWLGTEWSLALGLAAPSPLSGGWNPSMWVLLGGLAGGAGFALLARWLDLERLSGRQEAATELRKSGEELELARALQAGSGALERAFGRLLELLRQEPENAEASVAFWKVCDGLDRCDVAAPYLLRAVRKAVAQGEAGRATRGWLELERTEHCDGVEPALLLRMAMLLRGAGHDDAAIRTLCRALQPADPAAGSSAVPRVARAAVELDPDIAADAAWQALSRLEIDLEKGQTLEELLAPLDSGHALASGEPPASDPLPSQRPGDRPASNFDAETEPDGIEILGFDRALDLVTAIPLKVEDKGVLIAAGPARKRVRYDRIDAIAVAAVEGLADKPVIVLDLLLNWNSKLDEPLRVIRLRTDMFDPRPLIPDEGDPTAAVRALSVRLQQEASAIPLPDARSIRGEPFAGFKSLHEYQRAVLLIDREDESGT